MSKQKNMCKHNKNKQIGGEQNSPLKFYQPLNMLVFLSFYSPVIVAFAITSISFVLQNAKGFIYFGYLLGSLVLRNYAYMVGGADPIDDDGSICTSIQYSKYGNSGVSAFVFAFTIAYMAIPMFASKNPNFPIFVALLVYFISDMSIKSFKGCIKDNVDALLNVLAGATAASMIVGSMYAGGSSDFLFIVLVIFFLQSKMFYAR